MSTTNIDLVSNQSFTTTTLISNNSSNQTNNQDEIFFDYFILVLYFFTSMIAIFGNLFVCYVIHKTPKFKSTTFSLLFNMAVSDFFSGFIIITQWIFCSYWIIEKFSPSLCVINKAFQILSYYISTYSMMFIAIDRYLLIKHPHTKGLQSKKHKYLAVSSTWVVGFLFSLTCLYNMRINEYFGPNDLINCRIAYPVKGYFAFILRKYRIAVLIISQFLIPLIITSILYREIWIAIKNREMVGDQSSDSNKKKQFSKNKKKLIKMLIIVVVLFIAVWLPTHLIHFFNFYIVHLLPRSCNAGNLIQNLIYFLNINLFYFIKIGTLYNIGKYYSFN